MTSSRSPRRIHVERTANPAVLSWVVHDPRLAAAPAGRRLIPDDSPLGELIADGSIVSVSVRTDAVLVTCSDPATWGALAPRVQAAVLLELEEMDRARETELNNSRQAMVLTTTENLLTDSPCRINSHR